MMGESLSEIAAKGAKIGEAADVCASTASDHDKQPVWEVPALAVPDSTAPKPGDVFSVQFPFLRVTVELFNGDDEGPRFSEVASWKPGCEFAGQDQFGRDRYAAEGFGLMELKVVSVHKPGRFPTRVFFTRTFVTPDGKRFGKGHLRIATLGKFSRIATRYAYGVEIVDRIPNREAVRS